MSQSAIFHIKKEELIGDVGPGTGRSRPINMPGVIPSQIEVPVSSNPIRLASGLSCLGPSGPSELEKLCALHEVAKQLPWMLDLLETLVLVGVIPQGKDGTENTLPASQSMFCDE